jgi:hypothetical protein
MAKLISVTLTDGKKTEIARHLGEIQAGDHRFKTTRQFREGALNLLLIALASSPRQERYVWADRGNAPPTKGETASQLATGLSVLAPAQRAGAKRLRSFDPERSFP